MKKALLTTLIIITLFLPFSTFAALELEYRYPELPQTQPITTTSAMPAVIKYFATWAIIIASLVAAISLIVAGLQYLTSTGRPEAMNAAKDRIFNSFLGLLILLCSYLILITVNPQLTILRIEKIPVEAGTGIVLFTEDGLKEFEAGTSIDSLVGLGKVYYLNYEIENCKEEFGDLEEVTPIPVSGKKVNFKDFPLHAIGFWGEAGKKHKLIAFKEEKFKGEHKEYTFEGKLNVDGTVRPPNRSIPIGKTKIEVIIMIDDTDPAKSDFFKSDINPFGQVFHPFLSVRTVGTGPGIYLYDEYDSEQYLSSTREDFTAEDINFNDKARKIKIKNTNKEMYDYIAVLHEDTRWAEQLRIFFEKRDVDTPIKTDNISPNTGQNEYKLQALAEDVVGNVPPSTKAIIRDSDKAYIDFYGKVQDASSIWIEELVPAEEGCTKVQICTEKYLGGDCITYEPNKINYIVGVEEKVGDVKEIVTKEVTEDSVWPIFLPRNIPKEVTLKKDTQELGTFKFADQIRSIKIEPERQCLVVLFDHSAAFDGSLTSLVECRDSNKCWDGDTPGSHSQLFTKSNMDLTSERIGTCRGVMSIGRFGAATPCASAIAIYPIRSIGE